jgi:hypothetical protein
MRNGKFEGNGQVPIRGNDSWFGIVTDSTSQSRIIATCAFTRACGIIKLYRLFQTFLWHAKRCETNNMETTVDPMKFYVRFCFFHS